MAGCSLTLVYRLQATHDSEPIMPHNARPGVVFGTSDGFPRRVDTLRSPDRSGTVAMCAGTGHSLRVGCRAVSFHVSIRFQSILSKAAHSCPISKFLFETMVRYWSQAR